ncbi:hypothetical protein IDG52_01325 [Pelagibacterales bacterium SAG-MED23]|nr:hypothetical protein [Pelagibacterales bacterium SAG-MED23]
MFKKVILISICLILLVSCGRKNEPKYEVFLTNNINILKDPNNIFKITKKNEIYQ